MVVQSSFLPLGNRRPRVELILSLDDRLADRVLRIAEAQGKGLEELVRDTLEELTRSRSEIDEEMDELRRLSIQGNGRSKGWKFNREESQRPL